MNKYTNKLIEIRARKFIKQILSLPTEALLYLKKEIDKELYNREVI